MTLNFLTSLSVPTQGFLLSKTGNITVWVIAILLQPNQSKKLKKSLKEWALDPNGWKKPNSKQEYNLNKLDLDNDDSIYYKMRPINEDKNLFVTFSPKYLRYQRQIRENQINRAIKQANSKQKGRKNNPNDPARFITEKHFTENGEKADKVQYVINKD